MSQTDAGFGHRLCQKQMAVERSQQKRLLRCLRRQRGYLDTAAEQMGLVIRRVKSNGQTLMVNYERSAAGDVVARWWVVAGHLIHEDGQTEYGVTDEATALRRVASKLGLNMEA